MKESYCIFYSTNHLTHLRLELLFKNTNVSIVKAQTRLDISEQIFMHHESNALILIEIDNSDKSIGLIQEIKQVSQSVPIIVLGNEPKRDFAIKVMVAGVSDYIIKPFDETSFFDRIMNILAKKGNEEGTEETPTEKTAINLIRIDMIKAKKGKYPLCLGLIKLFQKNPGSHSHKEQHKDHLSGIFELLQDNLFETDTTLLLDSYSMLAFLPFCPKEQIILVENKIQKAYESYKSQHAEIRNYILVQVYETDISTAREAKDVFETLISKANEAIEGQPKASVNS